MVRHAIVLASRDWCEAAASGMIKVYDFFKPRKRKIRALVPGSVCIVMAKRGLNKPAAMYGEFTVRDVKEVDGREYSELASQGFIYNPQRLGPNDRRWIIFFEDFRKYRREVLKKELIDVKTETSREPVSEWFIQGLSYIDEKVLEEIRRRAGGYVETRPQSDERLRSLEENVALIRELLGISDIPFPITHTCGEFMLMNIGRDLGFEVYTADPSKECCGKRLGDLASMSKEYLSNIVGHEILKELSRVDVIWYKQGSGFYAFEVVIGGNMHESLLRFSRIGELGAKLFIVSEEKMRGEYERSIQNPVFTNIRHKCKFIPLRKLVKMYILTNLWRRSVEDLQLSYISR